MAKLYLVRHGKAGGDWGTAIDPGLEELGWQQARRAAEKLAPLGPIDIISSPLKRTRETSRPLSELWQVLPRIEERVGEIKSPTNDITERVKWLKHMMSKNWPDLDTSLDSFRQGVIDALLEIKRDTVVFTHFIAINVAVGVATNDTRVMNFLPNNGSITEMENSSGLALIKRGREAYTSVG